MVRPPGKQENWDDGDQTRYHEGTRFVIAVRWLDALSLLPPCSRLGEGDQVLSRRTVGCCIEEKSVCLTFASFQGWSIKRCSWTAGRKILAFRDESAWLMVEALLYF